MGQHCPSGVYGLSQSGLTHDTAAQGSTGKKMNGLSLYQTTKL